MINIAHGLTVVLKLLWNRETNLKNKLLKINRTFYWQALNKVNLLNIKSKKEFFAGKILASKGNMKQTWKTINEAIGKRSKSTKIDSINDFGDNIVNKESIANQMNSFVCSIGIDFAKDIEAAPNPVQSRHYDMLKVFTKKPDPLL